MLAAPLPTHVVVVVALLYEARTQEAFPRLAVQKTAVQLPSKLRYVFTLSQLGCTLSRGQRKRKKPNGPVGLSSSQEGYMNNSLQYQ